MLSVVCRAGLQILGFQMGVEDFGQNYKESSCCKKCVLPAREPNFVVFVVSREAGLKRAMCKKHCKYREKLASLHFDVLSSFYIVPRRRNMAPR